MRRSSSCLYVDDFYQICALRGFFFFFLLLKLSKNVWFGSSRFGRDDGRRISFRSRLIISFAY